MKQKFLNLPSPHERQSGNGQTRRLAYMEFGDPDNPNVLLCVHGVSRLSRDFDTLAEALADNYRVICPDMAGRGDSDWLDNAEDYSYPVYLTDVAALLAHIGAAKVHWIGTSMGGLIGMMLAAQRDSPIQRMVINDIGPVIPAASMTRIGAYLGTKQIFSDIAAGEAYLRDVHASFGPLTDEEWAHLAKHGMKLASEDAADEQAGFRLHYDPKIAEPFKAGASEDIVLWKIWDRILCPVLVLHGADSDLLSADTAAEMATRGPKAKIHTLSGIGHAPALMAVEQVELLRHWLLVN